jgi:WD40 repeat protein
MAFSHDGRFLLTGALDSTVRLWSIPSGKHVRDFKGHTREVYSVALSPDGKLAISGGADATVRLWEVATGREIRQFSGHSLYVTSVAFSPDGKRILTGAMDKTVRLFDATTGKELRQIEIGPSDSIYTHVSFSPDGRYFLATYYDRLELWSARTFREIREFVRTADSLTSVFASINGKELVVGSEDNTAQLWDLGTGESVRQFGGPPRSFINDHEFAVALIPNTTHVLTGGKDGILHMWDSRTGTEVARFVGHTDSITSIVVSSNGQQILTGGLDRTARLWDTLDGKEKLHLGPLPGLIMAVAISNDGRTVVTGSTDGVGTVWDIPTGQKRFELNGHDRSGAVTFNENIDPAHDKHRIYERREGGINAICFSPDNALILTGSHDRTARLWDAKTGKEIRVFRGHLAEVTSVAFSPDGKTVLSGSSDSSANLWDVASGQKLRHLEGHTEKVASVAFSPDGKWIFTASADGSLKVWAGKRGKLLATLVSQAGKGWSVITPDGRFDTRNFDSGLPISWVIGDDPYRPLAPEIFMRDYYEPRLLHRLLDCSKDAPQAKDACAKEFPNIRMLQDLNRVQPGVKIVSVKRTRQPDVAAVTVEVSAAKGQFQREGKMVTRATDVYDLRLFRAGQLVGQEPELDSEAEARLKNGAVLTMVELEDWKAARKIKPVTGQVELDARTGKMRRTFTVRLPHGLAGKQIEFTAYAFNENRVKSETARASYTIPNDAGPVRKRAYVITMGMNAYQRQSWDLHFAASDAKRIQEALTKRLAGYEVVPVMLISDCKTAGCPESGNRDIDEDYATKAGLHAVLEKLAGHELSTELTKSLPPGSEKVKKAEPDDLVVLSVSSHGYTSKKGRSTSSRRIPGILRASRSRRCSWRSGYRVMNCRGGCAM